MDFNENRPSQRNIHNSNIPSDNDSPNTDASTAKSLKKKFIIIGAIVAAIIIGTIAWLLISNASKKAEEDEAAKREAAEKLALEQQLAASELENATRDLDELEGQRNLIVNDTTKLRLTQQYEAARLEIERLQSQLKDTKNKSAAEIAKLRGEIDKHRALLKHYLEEIARLNKENEQLRAENEQLSSDLASTTARAQDLDQKNQVLNERMTLAEKLNVTGVNLSGLNAKGKVQKKIKKASQLLITFTIPQNNSTPVGQKTIYARVISPEGALLGGAGTFAFEDANVTCSAKKSFEYEGVEISGAQIYVDVNTTLTAGEYTVELFADNYRLCSRKFTMK